MRYFDLFQLVCCRVMMVTARKCFDLKANRETEIYLQPSPPKLSSAHFRTWQVVTQVQNHPGPKGVSSHSFKSLILYLRNSPMLGRRFWGGTTRGRTVAVVSHETWWCTTMTFAVASLADSCWRPLKQTYPRNSVFYGLLSVLNQMSWSHWVSVSPKDILPFLIQIIA